MIGNKTKKNEERTKAIESDIRNDGDVIDVWDLIAKGKSQR